MLTGDVSRISLASAVTRSLCISERALDGNLPERGICGTHLVLTAAHIPSQCQIASSLRPGHAALHRQREQPDPERFLRRGQVLPAVGVKGCGKPILGTLRASAKIMRYSRLRNALSLQYSMDGKGCIELTCGKSRQKAGICNIGMRGGKSV